MGAKAAADKDKATADDDDQDAKADADKDKAKADDDAKDARQMQIETLQRVTTMVRTRKKRPKQMQIKSKPKLMMKKTKPRAATMTTMTMTTMTRKIIKSLWRSFAAAVWLRFSRAKSQASGQSVVMAPLRKSLFCGFCFCFAPCCASLE